MGVQTERIQINMAPPQKKKKNPQKPESQRRPQHKDLAVAGDTKHSSKRKQIQKGEAFHKVTCQAKKYLSENVIIDFSSIHSL